MIVWDVGNRNVGTGPGYVMGRMGTLELFVMMLGEASCVNRRLDVFV